METVFMQDGSGNSQETENEMQQQYDAEQEQRVANDFFSKSSKPAPKRQRSGGIHTRLELLLAAAIAVLKLIRRGLPITSDEIVDGSGLAGDYNVRVGCKRVLMDTLGFADDDCARLWRDKRGNVRAVQENVRLLREVVPSERWAYVLERSGWASEAELGAFAATLPAVEG
jgi:hypothetical protein